VRGKSLKQLHGRKNDEGISVIEGTAADIREGGTSLKETSQKKKKKKLRFVQGDLYRLAA